VNPLDHACPTCHAKPGQRCRTTNTGRTTDTHNQRWNPEPLARVRTGPRRPVTKAPRDHCVGDDAE
jgi:hypothetical protein